MDANHPDAGATALDPVCGMKVNPETSAHHHTHAGVCFRAFAQPDDRRAGHEPEFSVGGKQRAEAWKIPGAGG